jgi:hypothetical protein
MDIQVVVKEEAWWTQVAPVLKIVHRPLPSLGSGNNKAAQRLAGADKTALKTPINCIEAFCKANGIDLAERIKLMHSFPQQVPASALSEGTSKGGKKKKGKGHLKGVEQQQSLSMETVGKEKVEELLKEVTEFLGACLKADCLFHVYFVPTNDFYASCSFC